MSHLPSGGRLAWVLTVMAPDIEQWRKEIAAAVTELGGGREAVDVARLGVTELLANVAEHVADPECCLQLVWDTNSVCVRLFDRSLALPAASAAADDAERGRGLWLLRELTDGLGYVLTGSGKWVWFRIHLNNSRVEAA